MRSLKPSTLSYLLGGGGRMNMEGESETITRSMIRQIDGSNESKRSGCAYSRLCPQRSDSCTRD